MKKRPKFISFLIAIFILVAFRSLGSLIWYKNDLTYQMLSQTGTGSLFPVMNLFYLLGAITLIILYRSRQKLGYYLTFAYITVAYVFNLAVVLIALSNIEIYSEIVKLASLARRGTAEGPAQLLANPSLLTAGIVITGVAYSVVGYMLYKREDHFTKTIGKVNWQKVGFTIQTIAALFIILWSTLYILNWATYIL